MKFFNRIPLVLLSGTGCNQILWEQLLPLLPNQMMPVMPDLLACGSQEDMLKEVTKLPYKKFILMGFSMGGYIAQRFYAMHPERVSHLMLLCTSGEKKQTDANVIEKNLKRMMNEAYLSHMINPVNSEHKQELCTKIITMLKQAGPEAVGRQMHATAHRRSVLTAFPENPAPTLVIGARQDKLVPAIHMDNLALALKSEVTWVESGHMLPLEAPDELSLIINAWLTSQNVTSKHEAVGTQGSIEELSSKFTL
ncbi:MAG: alpha/beta hydrolase [Legionellaceae bacterium]|nr:alpha/beta hydrolase [Legionellaceae bacterium]